MIVCKGYQRKAEKKELEERLGQEEEEIKTRQSAAAVNVNLGVQNSHLGAFVISWYHLRGFTFIILISFCISFFCSLQHNTCTHWYSLVLACAFFYYFFNFLADTNPSQLIMFFLPRMILWCITIMLVLVCALFFFSFLFVLILCCFKKEQNNVGFLSFFFFILGLPFFFFLYFYFLLLILFFIYLFIF